jgi:hypothetical protein
MLCHGILKIEQKRRVHPSWDPFVELGCRKVASHFAQASLIATIAHLFGSLVVNRS